MTKPKHFTEDKFTPIPGFNMKRCKIIKYNKQDVADNIANKLIDMVNKQLEAKPFEFYYNKSKHGDNFYKILKKIQVKNEHHDWREYYLYQQCGTLLEFSKPVDIFHKEFKKVKL